MKKFFLFLFLLVIAVPFAVLAYVQGAYALSVYKSDSVPESQTALVLGAAIYAGKPTTILQDRLETAYDLYKAGKVKTIILSGDHRAEDYNEPLAMKRFLLEKGVPEDALILDDGGLRTYDSCNRAKQAFHADKVVVISQRFHLGRALFLCNMLGVQAIGVSANKRDYDSKWAWREVEASFQAFWEVYISKDTFKEST